MTAHSSNPSHEAPIMFTADRTASSYERRVLSQAAYLSSACVADLLGSQRAPRFPAPAEELVPTRPSRR